MPVYEYECAKCGAHFDELQKFSDAPVKKHNGCGGRVKRVVSAPAFQFKGTGWYVTDYARKGGGASGDGKDTKESKESKESKKDSSSEKKTEAKSEGEKSSAKAESKPAEKSTKS